jgi:hypothetical protein
MPDDNVDKYIRLVAHHHARYPLRLFCEWHRLLGTGCAPAWSLLLPTRGAEIFKCHLSDMHPRRMTYAAKLKLCRYSLGKTNIKAPYPDRWLLIRSFFRIAYGSDTSSRHGSLGLDHHGLRLVFWDCMRHRPSLLVRISKWHCSP